MRSPLLSCLPLLLSALIALVAGCGVHGSEICPTSGPSPRAFATAVLVPSYNEVYLYGGTTGMTLAGSSIDSDELWRYSFGACSAWVKVVPTGTSPGGLSRYAAALDTKRNRILYVGGPTNETWSLDISKLTWTKLLTAGLPPSASQQPWAIYDADDDQLIVGSVFATPLAFADSDNGNWAAPLQFDAALGSAAAIDPTRDQIFTWNGDKMSSYSLNRAVGADVTYRGTQSASFVDGMGWDMQQKRLLALSGGAVYAIDGTDALGTMATSTLLAPTGTPPSARTGAAFAISGAVALIFGGETAAGCLLGDWWYLDNEASWESRSVATTCP
jgi:hypothetical protein